MTATVGAPPARSPAQPAGLPGPASLARPAPRMLPTLFGALSVISGATALVPLISGTSWLWPVAEIVALIWLVGVGARLMTLPPWATELLQVAAFVVTVTGLHLHTGIGGILPGPAAIDEVASAITTAWHQIMTTAAPMPPSPEVGLLVTLVLGVLALIVNLLIDAARAPALVALPLLALYSVPASIASELLPWYAFVLPAVCYAALLATSGPSRVRPPRRSASVTATGGVIVILSIAAALLTADMTTAVGTKGRLPHHGAASGQIGLSPWATLRGELTSGDPVDVLNVAGLSAPTYLRTFALETWDPGVGFTLGAVRAQVHDVNGAIASPPASGGAWATITPRQYRDKYLPLYLDATAVDGVAAGWNFDRELHTIFRSSATTPGPYRVLTDTSVDDAAALRTDSVVASPTLTQTGDLPAEVVDLARSITAETTNAFDAVDALLRFFTDPSNGFTYSLKTTEGSSGDALVDFLSQRQGYCEQYAAAMAIMVRAIGIPARVGIGFTQGARQPDGSYEIASTNAHAWVEVPFTHGGWVTFDPTPSVGGQGGLQGFTEDGASGPSTSPTGTDATTASGATSTAATTTAAPSTRAVATTTTLPGAAGAATGTPTAAIAGWAAVILGILAALAVVIVTPNAVRGRRRRRALRVAASGRPGSATAAWHEVVDTAQDHDVEMEAGTSARAIATRIRVAAQLSGRGEGRLHGLVRAVEWEWYGPRAAGDPVATPDLAPAVRTVIFGLRRSRPQSWIRRWWPRSLRRFR